MKPENFEERIIWYSMICTYGIYFLGLLYPFNSTLGWLLFFYLCKRLWDQTEDTPVEKKINIPWVLWLWVISMVVMAIATVVGCTDYDLGLIVTIRALLNWTRDWALLALFPLLGCLNIRPRLIYRLVCIVCLQSLILIPIFYLAYALHLPPLLYSSPVERLTQNGPIYYDVNLYALDYDTQQPRLFLFAPWGPALGLIGNIYFFFALQEPDKKWRWFGIAGSIAMCIVSVSRLAIISVPIVAIAVWGLTNFTRPNVQIAVGFISFISGIFGTAILTAAKDFWDAFKGARASSSRVHEALARIAFERWPEAPVWGHGIQDTPGPKVVAGMPIGSHHTWMGLLFVKGLVGFIAFLVPMLCSFIVLLHRAQKSETARVALSFLLILFLFTFNDTQEILAYLYWPGLVLMGIALKGKAQTSISLVEKYEATSI
jgi:hypothetical protein